MRWPWFLAFLLVLIGALPILSVASASWLAAHHGCVLNEAGTNPCVFWGENRGGMLTVMFVAGWFMFFTWPILGAGLALIALLLVIALIRRLRRLLA